jgi:hypothetical protein
MGKRKIEPHKGGRTERIEARITAQAKGELKQILARTSESFADWLERKIREDSKRNK